MKSPIKTERDFLAWNRQDRLQWIERWAEYVNTHDDWSQQQKIFIDAQICNARAVSLSREDVDAFKLKAKRPSLL